MIGAAGALSYVWYGRHREYAAYIDSTEYLAGVIEGKGPSRGKIEAIQRLINRKEDSIAPALTRALDDPDNDVRWKSLEALVARDDTNVVPSLRHAMASGHWGMQKWAIEHLANRQDPAIVPALLQAAKDKQREVRVTIPRQSRGL
jgi:HEAT repeat protein